MTDLPDVNVWFALLQPNNDKHLRSQRYWQEESQDRIAFCQITAHGLLRTLTNSNATSGDPLTLAEAWNEYQRLQASPRVSYVSETTATARIMTEWIEHSVFTPRMWTDAHLAALAVAYDFRFVTFDRDFRRFPGLKVLLLEPDPVSSDEAPP